MPDPLSNEDVVLINEALFACTCELIRIRILIGDRRVSKGQA